MSYSNNNINGSVPQGFSIYQPQIGAPLEFLPALGTKMLDDMINAYIPGPSTMQQKRAQVSLEFLTHFQQTGQSFKFFVVSDATFVNPDSPAQGSSSFTVSPVTSDWDWSSANAGTPGSSSRSASSRKSGANSRHQTAGDFSHMPGMKIMTKEGLDVTNSASRGSKTKEQRDHAHLMRIIKACDSCRKKKIRCDPSHKKRAAAAASQPVAKASKKVKMAAPAVSQKPTEAPAARLSANMVPPPAPSLDLDSFPAFEPVDDIAMPLEASQSWEDFIHYPQDMDTDYDFFFDPEGLLTPSISDASPSSSNATSSKPISPTSQNAHVVSDLEGSQLLATDVFATGELHNVDGPQLPYLDVSGGSANYTDFNLYSPASSFSEDERMLSVASSTPSTSADGVSQARSPPDRPHAPRDESKSSSVDDSFVAVSLDGQLRWASSDDLWSLGSGSVDATATGVGSSASGVLASNGVINTEHLLETEIMDFHGQDRPLFGDQNVNAVDRSILHQQLPTEASSTVRESPSHAQLDNVHAQNNILQSTRLSTDNLLRTPGAVTSSNAVGSDQELRMATSSSAVTTVTSPAMVSTSRASESSLVAIPSSSRSVGWDAADVLLRDTLATVNSRVEHVQGALGEAVSQSLQTTVADRVVDVLARGGSSSSGDLGTESSLGVQLRSTGEESLVEHGQLHDGSRPLAAVAATQRSSMHSGAQYIDNVMVGSSTLQPSRDATTASVEPTAGFATQLGSLATPSCAFAILSVCLSILVLGTAMGKSPWAVTGAIIGASFSFLRVLSDVAPRESCTSTAQGLVREILSGRRSCRRGGSSSFCQTSSPLGAPMGSRHAVTVW